jgi:hypothetical protein
MYGPTCKVFTVEDLFRLRNGGGGEQEGGKTPGKDDRSHVMI